MYRVVKEIDFCYGHRLLNYDGKCRHLHGHNGRAEIEIETDSLDEVGMACDFTRIKKEVKGWIDRNLDHRMILHRDDPFVTILEREGEPVTIIPENPTAETIARMIFDAARDAGLAVRSVTLWETPTSHASYSA